MLATALLLAEQIADLGEQLDVGRFGWAGLFTALACALIAFIGTTITT